MISMRSKITKGLLGYFMLHDKAEMYGNELARKLGLDDGNLARKLQELERLGLLKSREMGKARFYSLNRAYPLLKEYRRIILKTIGLEKMLRNGLKDLVGIKEAVIFGSYAANEMDAASDIDLFVVGDCDTVQIRKRIHTIQKNIDREINLVSMGVGEYEKKKKEDPFVKSIQKAKKVPVIP